MTYDGNWRETFRPDIPSVARIYDYLLGGKDNYEADRAVGESMIAQLPNVRLAVQWNRAFLRRVVRYLVHDAGIRQIVDVGAGLPSAGNTHEIALDACPQTRVVYVDHDPVVLAHARDMLHGVPSTAIIGQDMLEPDTILADPALRNLIDFGEPVALLFLSILHFVAERVRPGGNHRPAAGPVPSRQLRRHLARHARHGARGQRRGAGLRRVDHPGPRPHPGPGQPAGGGDGDHRARPDLAAAVAPGSRR